MKKMVVALFLTLTACSINSPDNDNLKPERDPDAHSIAGKADVLTDYYTDIKGELALDGDAVISEIDYPDWFHGYTLDLEAGQTIRFEVFASDLGYLRLYGPATHTDGEGNPRFGRAWGAGLLEDDAEFTIEVEDSGTYMLVYGPRYVWSADYTFQAFCENCESDKCNGDWECASGEFCGDNGVRCITFPCDVNFDICQPGTPDGSFCDRDRMCANGSVCLNGECKQSTSCSNDADCAGFCGYDELGGRVCRPFAEEGTLCGGFVRPQDYRQCSPDVSCNAPNFIADIGGTCGLMVTVAELVANPQAYDGRHIAVNGFADYGPSACTRIACPVDNPCCNRCGNGINLVDTPGSFESVELQNAGSGERWACNGDECNMYETCTVEEAPYFIAGTFRVGQFGNTIEVERSFRGVEFN